MISESYDLNCSLLLYPPHLKENKKKAAHHFRNVKKDDKKDDKKDEDLVSLL